ncbi:hypothetical protein J6590_057732 [Homalodisca vitripennis]|nr:hypothetical protein J6590_057732 [Homalodisca vitripennis]
MQHIRKKDYLDRLQEDMNGLIRCVTPRHVDTASFHHMGHYFGNPVAEAVVHRPLVADIPPAYVTAAPSLGGAKAMRSIALVIPTNEAFPDLFETGGEGGRSHVPLLYRGHFRVPLSFMYTIPPLYLHYKP